MKIINILAGFLLFCTIDTNAQVSKILDQNNPPIIIDEFTSSYQKENNYRREGIKYNVKFYNNTNTTIVAYKIGFYAFDVFNESLGRPLGGFSIQTINAGAGEESVWVQNTYNASLFDKYGTAIAYVSAVRLIDGTIWQYDSENILTQLQELEESLTIDDLESDEN